MDDVRRSNINASYVRGPKYEVGWGAACVADPDKLPEYIVAQGPELNNVAEFLTMLYEQQVPLVIYIGKPNSR